MKNTSERHKNIIGIGGRMVAGFFNSYFRSRTLCLTTAHNESVNAAFRQRLRGSLATGSDALYEAYQFM